MARMQTSNRTLKAWMCWWQARAARMARMQGLKAELQRVETELEEAQAGHEEANEFGDDDLAAEFAAAERRLQVKFHCCQTLPYLASMPALFCRLLHEYISRHHGQYAMTALDKGILSGCPIPAWSCHRHTLRLYSTLVQALLAICKASTSLSAASQTAEAA